MESMKYFRILFWLIVASYLVTRLFHLTLLPIFADEAIYIRWAMMIFHDPKQYIFLPLYDGKSPLFIWTLIPLVKLFFLDPLFASRLLSAIFGLSSLCAIVAITKRLGGSPFAQHMSGILVVLTPYALFHDRMGLIDSSVTSWLSWAVYFFLSWRESRRFTHILLVGLFWGLALLTKTTAFYIVPVFAGWWFVDFVRNPRFRCWKSFWQPGIALFIGLLLIAWMRVSPLFPFLFRRSSDFAFTIQEIISKPLYILSLNAPKIGLWWWTYLTPIILGILLVGLCLKHSRSIVVWMLLGLSLFTIPFLVSGRLLASRYLLPSIIFVLPAVGITLDVIKEKHTYLVAGVLLLLVGWCGWFDSSLWFSPQAIPFTADDARQYLSDWSAGYGIPETRDYIISRVNAGKKVLVGTEGYFGTLPDGLFVYFSETSYLKHMEIFGLGQPLISTPPQLKAKSVGYDETYMLVNENRITYDYTQDFILINRFEKPHSGPPLLLLQLKP
jgi:4-amino-4-deoxy-L-arabinose transferase-like glycosyltransferase